jgi:hypothetical protein
LQFVAVGVSLRLRPAAHIAGAVDSPLPSLAFMERKEQTKFHGIS